MVSNNNEKNLENDNSIEKEIINGNSTNNILNILDGAKSQFPPIAPELEIQRKIASD
jgi:hypothetical protein